MTGSITVGALCLIILVIAALRVGIGWTIAIVIASTGVGFTVVLSGIAGDILQAINTAATAASSVGHG